MSSAHQNDFGGKRVLLVRLGSMGDIIHALPVPAALKHAFPSWEVDWLVERRWRGLLDGNPCLARVMEFDTLGWRGALWSKETWAGFGGALAALQARGYDYALDLQGAFKSAIACRASGARSVIGFEQPWLREPGASVFYSRRVAPPASHVVEANLALAGAMGARLQAAKFPLPEGCPRELPREIAEAAAAGNVAVINPGAGWRAKQWPADRYGPVCDALACEYGLLTIINCGPQETALVNEVGAACRVARPAAYTGALEGLIALLRSTRLMIAPDTGPLHLAAALGVPTVALFGPTDPMRNGPYGNRTRSLRAAGAATSHRHTAQTSASMLRIDPSEVIAAARELLDGGEAGAAKQPCAATSAAGLTS